MSHYISLYDEILFSIRFNTTLSTIEMEKISVLVTSLKTITQAIIVTQETLPSFISKKKKKKCSPSPKIFETSTFYHIFSYFYQWVGFVIFQICTKFLINQLKYFFTQDTLHLSFISWIECSPSEVSRNTQFLPQFF